MSQEDGFVPHDTLERISKLVDDLRVQLASQRAITRRRGFSFPPKIINFVDRLSQDLEELHRILHNYDIERNNLHALVQIGQVINSSLDLTTVLNEVVDTIIRLTGAERAFLMLHDSSGELETVTARNWKQESLEPHEYELSQTIVGRVLNEGKAILTTNAQNDPRFGDQSSVITYSLRSILCVPLIVKGDLKGVIYADNRIREGLFTEKEHHLLSAFANQAAVAIENAQLYNEIRRYADELEQRVAKRTEELADANRHLRALTRLKDEFIANVSHELRTPISSLKLYCTLLEKPSEKIETYIESVKRETIRLEHIIESLLRLSSFDQDQIMVDLSPLNPNELVELLVQDRTPLAKSSGHELHFQGQSNLSLALADKELITEALSILLTNAFNYTPEGGKISVRTETQDRKGQQWVGIHVTDTGPGIPKGEKGQIFQRFFRGEVGRKSGIAGTGLGLAIVKAIMQRNQGEVEVSSEGTAGKGATFTLWLPALSDS